MEAAYETPRSGCRDLRPPPSLRAFRSTRGRLFPAFPFEGALLIGVKDLRPPARLTLLVQVSDGSGDPLKQAPPAVLVLDGDGWTAFDPQDVDDKTAELHRLRRSRPQRSRKARHGAPHPSGGPALVPHLGIDRRRRAQPVAFDRRSVRPRGLRRRRQRSGFLETPLAAGTIRSSWPPTRDQEDRPALQLVRRPAGRERTDAFATRVSERLRHKDRAVTMFDYEIACSRGLPPALQGEVPEHDRAERNAQNHIVADNELMPGAVTVVTVPWTHGQNARNPLRPYTDQATLTAVDGFLRKRVSPFVRLEVQNPKFEEVQVDFQVRFKPEIGDIAFYIDELNKALVSFLTPWSRADGGEITFGGKLWKSTDHRFRRGTAPSRLRHDVPALSQGRDRRAGRFVDSHRRRGSRSHDSAFDPGLGRSTHDHRGARQCLTALPSPAKSFWRQLSTTPSCERKGLPISSGCRA